MESKCKCKTNLLLGCIVLATALTTSTHAQISSERTITGEGAPNFLPRWTGVAGLPCHEIRNSIIYEDGASRSIGIGTTAPSSMLHLFRDLSVYPEVGITIQGTPFPNSRWFIGKRSSLGNNDFIITNESLQNDPCMVIDAGGWIGMGLSSPGSELHLNGSLTVNNDIIFPVGPPPQGYNHKIIIQEMPLTFTIATIGFSNDILKILGNRIELNGRMHVLDEIRFTGSTENKLSFKNQNLEFWADKTVDQKVLSLSGDGDVEVFGLFKTDSLKIEAGCSDKYVLRSDPDGNAYWSEPAWKQNGNSTYVLQDKIGIGSQNPATKLFVSDDVSAHVGVGIDNGDFPWFLGMNKDINSNSTLYVTDLNAMGSSDTAFLAISTTGNVGIGMNSPEYKLDVKGDIRATEVKIQHPDQWYDFVFDKNYGLPTPADVEQFIRKNGHLPEIPDRQTVLSEGFEVGEFSGLLLKKIEELTLYIIDQEKRIKELESIVSDHQENK